MLNVTEITCQQALNRINSKFLPFAWDLNIYRGCQHGCIYCYAIYSHDYLEAGSFSDDIYVKVNIVEQLERQLSSPRWKGGTINIGGVTDSYQPLEAKYKFMPDIFKLLIKHKTPCTISTKSDLMLRDYDLIDELSKIASVNVSATITCADAGTRKKIEPLGKDALEKFHMLKEFAKTGASTGFHHMPIVPYITDKKEDIEQLYACAADSKVGYVLTGVLYLRGKTRKVFFDAIAREYPELLQALRHLYQKREAYKAYGEALYQGVINGLRRKYGLRSYANPGKGGAKEKEESKQLTLF